MSTNANLLITRQESIFLKIIPYQLHYSVCRFRINKKNFTAYPRGEEKDRETEPDSEPCHITPYTHLSFLPPSVVFLMIHDKLVIAFGDESFMFLTY